MKYYLIAGEASGDLHGSNLIRGLKVRDPQGDFRFWGGDLMLQAGGTLVGHYKESAVMGIVEVVAKLRTISRRLVRCKEDLLQYNPDVVILIDYPGFNLKIAKFAKRHGFKVFYYIPPKVWARGEGRIKILKQYVDEIFAIFPFEVDYFKERGIIPHYLGNPLIDSIAQSCAKYLSKEEFCNRYSLDPDKRIIAFLTGSREMEVKFLAPRVVKAAALLRKNNPDIQFLLAAAPSIDISIYNKYIPEGADIKLIQQDTCSILKYADGAVISSGTASLEAALIGTPQVVCYGFNEITYLLAKLLVRVKYISLANLICNKLIFKELIQHQASPEGIAEEMEKILCNSDYVARMKSDYIDLNERLGGGGASQRIGEEMIKLILQNK